MADWEEQLADAGCRITASRRAAMEILRKTDVPLCPQEILEQAQVLHPNLGLVTVYRTVNLFADLGLLRRVHREDGCHAYVLASPGHHHVVVCERCGRALEFHGEDDIEALIRRVSTETGFTIQDHLLQLFGLCSECQNTKR